VERARWAAKQRIPVVLTRKFNCDQHQCPVAKRAAGQFGRRAALSARPSAHQHLETRRLGQKLLGQVCFGVRDQSDHATADLRLTNMSRHEQHQKRSTKIMHFISEIHVFSLHTFLLLFCNYCLFLKIYVTISRNILTEQQTRINIDCVLAFITF